MHSQVKIKSFRRAVFPTAAFVVLAALASGGLSACGASPSGIKSLPPTSSDPLEAEQEAMRVQSAPVLTRRQNDALLQDLFELPRTQSDGELAKEAQQVRDKRNQADRPTTETPALEPENGGVAPSVHDPAPHDVLDHGAATQQEKLAPGKKEPRVRDSLHDVIPSPENAQASRSREPKVRDPLHDKMESRGESTRSRALEPKVRDRLHDVMPSRSAQQPQPQRQQQPTKGKIIVEPIEVPRQTKPVDTSTPAAIAPVPVPSSKSESLPRKSQAPDPVAKAPIPQRKPNPPAETQTSSVATAPEISTVTSNGVQTYNGDLCERINVASTELEVDLAALTFENIEAPETMPVEYLRNIERATKTKGLKMSAVQLKKNRFVCILLPIALRMNAQVFNQRLEVLRIEAKFKSGQELSADEKNWIAQLQTSYRLPAQSTFGDLLSRVDIVPVALLLAQAAEESEWGTSRFAEVANNLFGMHGTPGKDCEPARGNANVCLRRFATLTEGVAAYIKYLNTGSAQFHMQFRRARMQMRAAGTPLDSVVLARSLNGYSKRGAAYCEQIKAIMSDWNNFTKYEFKEESVEAAQRSRSIDPQR